MQVGWLCKDSPVSLQVSFLILSSGLMVVEIRGRMAGQPLEGNCHRKGRGHGNKDNSMVSPEMAEASAAKYCILPMA